MQKGQLNAWRTMTHIACLTEKQVTLPRAICILSTLTNTKCVYSKALPKRDERWRMRIAYIHLSRMIIGCDRRDQTGSWAGMFSVDWITPVESCRVTTTAEVCMVWMEECAWWACCLQLERGGPSLSDSHSTVMDMKGSQECVSAQRAAFHFPVPTWVFDWIGCLVVIKEWSYWDATNSAMTTSICHAPYTRLSFYSYIFLPQFSLQYLSFFTLFFTSDFYFSIFHLSIFISSF